MKKNLLIVHGGGPTAVINSSLYGILSEAYQISDIGKIFAAENGMNGLLNEKFIDLSSISKSLLKDLLDTPGSAIGTSRDELRTDDYRKAVFILEKHNIGFVLMNGGNGTMDTCRKLFKEASWANSPCGIIGIPKTTDNDLAYTDHSPGYGSAARYIAKSTRDLCMDVKGLPIHAVVLEVSGRNAGWIAASSALSKGNGCDGPDLIYFPEIPFEKEVFLQDVSECLKRKKGIVIVASEGLKDKNGIPIVPPIFKTGRSTYFGDVGTYLATMIIKETGYKSRGEKPGLLGRCCMDLISPVDQREAIETGRYACRMVANGETGKMVSIQRKSISKIDYSVEYSLVDLEKMKLSDKVLPRNFINNHNNYVSDKFIDYCKPLIGPAFKTVISFSEDVNERIGF